MNFFMPQPMENLVRELAKLPGIGERTALRLALAMLRKDPQNMRDLARALDDVLAHLKFCSICQNITQNDPCAICNNHERNRGVICVVEDPADLVAIERSQGYRGLYHILHGTLSPIDGIGPQDLKIPALIARLSHQKINEMILALNPNVTGEATCLYLKKLIKPLGIKITQLAQGIPVGSDIEYLDILTLSRAFAERREV